jgi:transcriptional regulator of acetoin/glycerol metabolism
MLLRTLGDDGFATRAERVALRPGAQWSEACRGTNAIGTALAEAAPVVVHGGEHYLARNAFLTCAAAPIFDPAGGTLGVFDLSGDQRGHTGPSLAHALGLVRAAASRVEHRLFQAWHGRSLVLRLHPRAGGLGTLAEGLLALDDGGTVVGANAAALAALGLARQQIGRVGLADCLQTDLPALLDWARAAARSADATPRQLQDAQGQPLWARVQAPAGLAAPREVVAAEAPLHTRAGLATAAGRPQPAPRSAPHDALAALNTGDATVAAAVQRARRVLDKPIALLVHGESGTGKEVFARALHACGPRRGGPFVAVNCAALPETLIEAELFGYSAGAFTGARRDGAPGRIREAQGGTLLLDEIGDMPLVMQARLLRVLQDRAVVPLGGGRPVPVDFALVCATHRRLRDEIAAGRFREDLYYRLNGLALTLPPLRERSDFAALVAAMLAELAPGRPLRLAPDLAAVLATHRWPGNLRQLHNALRTACALLADDEAEIGWAHLSDDLRDDLAGALRQQPAGGAAAAGQPAGATRPDGPDGPDSLRSVQARTVARVVADCGGNLSEAARRLGIGRGTLYRQLQRAG